MSKGGDPYEEPHARAQCSRSEAVERSDRVDVDRVGGVARHDCVDWKEISFHRFT